MKLNFNCINCNINQVIKLMKLSELDRHGKEELMKEALNYLSDVDYNKCNPEITGEIWQIIIRHIKDDNPYDEIKKYYNREVLKMMKEMEEMIYNSNDKFNTALKLAITGNLIDFEAKHSFDVNVLKEKLRNIEKTKLVVDDSRSLYESLKNAKILMYLGDNCGEICLDKLFIKYIKNQFPGIKVYFAVRGKVIVNDITLEDAKMVDMHEVAEVIENGDGSLGTVMGRVSSEFKEKFYEADVVIAKGQGNYESLSEIDRNNVFHLFMAKCEAVAGLLGVNTMSIVCAQNKAAHNKFI